MAPPPIPAHRKVKLVTALKNKLSEQTSKLQVKHHAENDLLEDIRSYTKFRAAAEKEYAQALLKITTQLLAKVQVKDEEEEKKLPDGLWRKVLKETESLANSRMKIAQTMIASVSESIKTLKSERVITMKKSTAIAERIHEELQASAAELIKSQKVYMEAEKLTLQAKEQAAEAQERLKKGSVGIFSSRAKLEKTSTKANEKYEVCEKRSTIARNDYLLMLAAINAEQHKYYKNDLPGLIAMQDGNIYESFRNFYTILTNAEIDACNQNLSNFRKLEEDVSQLNKVYALDYFHKKNPVFSQYDTYSFKPVTGDKISSISLEYGASVVIDKEARKWTLRYVREQNMIKKKQKQLSSLQSDNNNETIPDLNPEAFKLKEQNIEALVEEIRHLEVLIVKAEGRIQSMRLAGVNVDEWLQSSLLEKQSDDDDDDDDNYNPDDTNDDSRFSSGNNDDFDDSEFPDEDKTSYLYTPVIPDDTLSVTSSIDQQRVCVTQALALYTFQSTSQEEISISSGEKIEIIEYEGDGWCKVRNKAGQVGYVPEAYIQLIDAKNTSTEDDFICYAKALYDYDACEEEELSFKEGDFIKVISQQVDDDDGWWIGIYEDRKGIFPNIVVEVVDNS